MKGRRNHANARCLVSSSEGGCDQDHDDRERRRVAELVLEEALAPDVVGKDVGRVAGPSPGQDVDDVEELERVEDPEKERDGEDRGDEREGDVAEAPPPGGVQDERRLLQVLVHSRQPRPHHHRHEADVEGDVADGDRAQSLLDIPAEHRVENLEELGEEQQHHHRHGHVGDDDGEIEQGVEHLAALELEAL